MSTMTESFLNGMYVGVTADTTRLKRLTDTQSSSMEQAWQRTGERLSSAMRVPQNSTPSPDWKGK